MTRLTRCGLKDAVEACARCFRVVVARAFSAGAGAARVGSFRRRRFFSDFAPSTGWAELDAWARRLLLDVHTLARAYGWSERDILQLTETRRQFYLNLIGGAV